jgi:serine/threonine protein phosphatase PrpC
MIETKTNLQSWYDTDTGRKRTHNEDRCYGDAQQGIFVVVDGVGGQAAGEKAAETALRCIRDRLASKTGSVADRVREAIALANNEIYRLSQIKTEWEGMACVLTIAVVENNIVTVGHVGDTRLYKLCKGKIEKKTRDHSPVGEREDNKEISEEEAMSHPRRNEVYRDVGSENRDKDEEDFIDIFNMPFTPQDALLLCSDGLSDMITSEVIRKIAESFAGQPKLIVEHLIKAANEAGGKDNISVVFVEGSEYADKPLGEFDDFYASVAENIPTGALREDNTAPDEETGRQSGVAETVALQAQRLEKSPPTAIIESKKEQSKYQSPFPDNPHHNTAESGRNNIVLFKGGGGFLSEDTTFSKVRRIFVSRVLIFIYGLILGLILMFFLQLRFGVQRITSIVIPTAKQRKTVGQNPQADFRTITEAMENAREGDTIEVAPGVYAEQVQLKEGVNLVSLKTREAIIRPNSRIAVIASGLNGGRIDGFKITADENTPMDVGLRIMNSDIEAVGLEISMARLAGIEIDGTGTSLLRADLIHDNLGIGILIKGNATPKLMYNHIKNNKQNKKNISIKITEQAKPDLVHNTTDGIIESSK